MIPLRKALTSIILVSAVAALAGCGPDEPNAQIFGIHMVDLSSGSAAAMEQAKATNRTPPGTVYVPGREGDGVIVKRNTALNSDCLEDIDAGESRGSGDIVIRFRLNKSCSQIFAKMTAENVGERMAIVLDGKVFAAPRINASITSGTGFVDGDLSWSEANRIAKKIRRAASLN